uniref:DNA polymerase IV n=1 Tax=Prevotella sp. GTC17260 TaxID=3236796 RepID=A0AB33JF06_9BACT
MTIVPNLRKIIHVDMDAFYASVEQRDDPSLRGKPIAVGGDGERSVLTTASYEARRFGVHSAMPTSKAKRLCPELILVPVDFEKYRAVSSRVHAIFRDYTDVVEPISLDEAFLDVTNNKKGIELAVDIAREIRQRIKSELRLTASAGVSYNKLLAKIASDYRKPDGLTVIHPSRALEFLARLPIEDFWGVGAKTAERMHALGIFSGLQLQQCSQEMLVRHFGKMGGVFYQFAHGVDLRPVEAHYIRKSLGCERTFSKDLSQHSSLVIELYHLTEELVRRIAKKGFKGTTLTLKVKYSDFTQVTRSMTRRQVFESKEDILSAAKQLMAQIEAEHHEIRLLGLSVSHSHGDGEEERAEWTELEIPFPEWIDGEMKFPDV